MNNSCNQDKWGPHAWKYFHTITLSYPIEPTDKHKEAFRREFDDLIYKLPCSECQKHFYITISKNPITDDVLSTKDKLVRWLIDIHNMVNKMLGKKERAPEDMILYHEINSGCFLSPSSTDKKNKLLDKITVIKGVVIDDAYIYYKDAKMSINDVLLSLLNI